MQTKVKHHITMLIHSCLKTKIPYINFYIVSESNGSYSAIFLAAFLK